MDGQFLTVFAIALAAGLASLAGGVAAILLRPSSLFLSIAVGFAGGVLLGTFAFEMLPKALEMSSLIEVTAGFALGFALVYGLDLIINRGLMADPRRSRRNRCTAFTAAIGRSEARSPSWRGQRPRRS